MTSRSNGSVGSDRIGGNGVGFLSLLFLLFLGLKLGNVITWSWWWVFSPLWIPFFLVIVVSICIAAFFGSVWLSEQARRTRRHRKGNR